MEVVNTQAAESTNSGPQVEENVSRAGGRDERTSRASNNEKMFNMNIEEIKEYLTTVSEESKIYLGCDSERVRKNGIWYADYAIVLVVHKGGNNGCKIFGDIIRERDYDQKKDKPALRLMTEVYKVSAFYLENLEFLESYDTEIHIDINPDEQFGSSCVLSQAIGYIK